MIAICPAGPPKLMKPSFSQKRSAFAERYGSTNAARSSRGLFRHQRVQPSYIGIAFSSISWSSGTAPRAEGGRQQPRRLGCQVEAIGIGAAHDGGQTIERRVGEAKVLEQRVEAAALAAVRDARAGKS
jgi:hypothetical protein